MFGNKIDSTKMIDLFGRWNMTVASLVGVCSIAQSILAPVKPNFSQNLGFVADSLYPYLSEMNQTELGNRTPYMIPPNFDRAIGRDYSAGHRIYLNDYVEDMGNYCVLSICTGGTNLDFQKLLQLIDSCVNDALRDTLFLYKGASERGEREVLRYLEGDGNGSNCFLYAIAFTKTSLAFVTTQMLNPRTFVFIPDASLDANDERNKLHLGGFDVDNPHVTPFSRTLALSYFPNEDGDIRGGRSNCAGEDGVMVGINAPDILDYAAKVAEAFAKNVEAN